MMSGEPALAPGLFITEMKHSAIIIEQGDLSQPAHRAARVQLCWKYSLRGRVHIKSLPLEGKAFYMHTPA